MHENFKVDRNLMSMNSLFLLLFFGFIAADVPLLSMHNQVKFNYQQVKVAEFRGVGKDASLVLLHDPEDENLVLNAKPLISSCKTTLNSLEVSFANELANNKFRCEVDVNQSCFFEHTLRSLIWEMAPTIWSSGNIYYVDVMTYDFYHLLENSRRIMKSIYGQQEYKGRLLARRLVQDSETHDESDSAPFLFFDKSAD